MARLLRRWIDSADVPGGAQPGPAAVRRRPGRARDLRLGRGDSRAAAFTSAISGLRELSTPYHLAGGLLDHAEYLARHGDAAAAGQATGEARDIARRLRRQPLLDRAADMAPAESRRWT